MNTYNELLVKSILFNMAATAEQSKGKNGYNLANFTNFELKSGLVVAKSHSKYILKQY